VALAADERGGERDQDEGAHGILRGRITARLSRAPSPTRERGALNARIP
jgi:hypothetical protein